MMMMVMRRRGSSDFASLKSLKRQEKTHRKSGSPDPVVVSQ